MIDLENYMKLTRGKRFYNWSQFGDTKACSAGNCTTNTVGSNYQQTATPKTGAIAADSSLIHLRLHS